METAHSFSGSRCTLRSRKEDQDKVASCTYSETTFRAVLEVNSVVDLQNTFAFFF